MADTAKETVSSYMAGNATISEAIMETASMAVSATLNLTQSALGNTAAAGAKERMSSTAMSVNNSSNGFDWLRGVLEKKQVRIPCVDVVVRL